MTARETHPTCPTWFRSSSSRPGGRALVRHLLRLLKDRIIFVGGGDRRDRQPRRRPAAVPRQRGPKNDVHMYINSPGGSVTAGLGIIDTMKFIKPDVCTYIIGQAASWARSSPPAAPRASATPSRTPATSCTSPCSRASWRGRRPTSRSRPARCSASAIASTDLQRRHRQDPGRDRTRLRPQHSGSTTTRCSSTA
jgi:hypothetical protein